MVTQIIYRGKIKTLGCEKKDKIVKTDKKEYYFDDLVMSNILSFIPKYDKRYTYFREGVYEEQMYFRGSKYDRRSNAIHEYRKTPNIVIIKKVTPKMVLFKQIYYEDLHLGNNINTVRRKKKQVITISTNEEKISDDDYHFIRAIDLVPLTDRMKKKILDMYDDDEEFSKEVGMAGWRLDR